MHVGIFDRPFVPLNWCPNRGSHGPLINIPVSPGLRIVTSLGSEKKEPECCQGFTLTQNVSWGFLHYPTPPTQGPVDQSHYVEMSSEGVMSSKEVGNDPGLYPVKGQ